MTIADWYLWFPEFIAFIVHSFQFKVHPEPISDDSR
jgi:hypothetical protein